MSKRDSERGVGKPDKVTSAGTHYVMVASTKTICRPIFQSVNGFVRRLSRPWLRPSRPADRFAQVSGDAILMVEHSLPDGSLHRDTGVRECEAREFCSKPRWPSFVLPVYSTSVGSLNKTVSLMLPCPNCGYPVAAGLPGSRFEAVSSGGNNTSEFRKVSMAADLPGGSAA